MKIFNKTALVLSVFCLAAFGRWDQPVLVEGDEPIAMKKAGQQIKTRFVMQKWSQDYAVHLVATRGKASRPIKSLGSLLPVSRDEFLIDAIALTDPQGMLKSLQYLGLNEGAVAVHVVSVRLPIRFISKLEKSNGFRFAHPAFASTRVTAGPAVIRILPCDYHWCAPVHRSALCSAQEKKPRWTESREAML
jgi:hypothetical protein